MERHWAGPIGLLNVEETIILALLLAIGRPLGRVARFGLVSGVFSSAIWRKIQADNRQS